MNSENKIYILIGALGATLLIFMLIIPPVIGLLGEQSGSRIAISLVLLSGAFSFAVGTRVRSIELTAEISRLRKVSEGAVVPTKTSAADSSCNEVGQDALSGKSRNSYLRIIYDLSHNIAGDAIKEPHKAEGIILAAIGKSANFKEGTLAKYLKEAEKLID